VMVEAKITENLLRDDSLLPHAYHRTICLSIFSLLSSVAVL
jgi:hypothetical protein